MRAILRDDPTMVSFFRRKKPEPGSSQYSIEELAAAFPSAPAVEQSEPGTSQYSIEDLAAAFPDAPAAEPPVIEQPLAA